MHTYQGLPCGQIQVEIFDPGCIRICISGQQHDCVFCFDRYKTQSKNIPAATVVALQNCVPKRAVPVQLDLLQLGLHLNKPVQTIQ